ncbi:MAG: hypothetical protein IJ860_02700 [Eubacterium sp.]|nr:hypothetical protein [Eubacterium sp.]
MSVTDICLTAAIVLAVLLALRRIHVNHKTGKGCGLCTGGCGICTGSCSNCAGVCAKQRGNRVQAYAQNSEVTECRRMRKTARRQGGDVFADDKLHAPGRESGMEEIKI